MQTFTFTFTFTFIALAITLSATSFAQAAPNFASIVPLEIDFHHRNVPEDKWEMLGSVEPNVSLHRLTIALRSKDEDGLRNVFEKVSDPKSPSYKQYYSIQDLAQSFGHTEDSLILIRQWVERCSPHAFVSLSTGGSFASIEGLTVGEARLLLGTDSFALYGRKSGNDQIIRAVEYFVPENISKIAYMISGVLDFPPAQRIRVHPASRSIKSYPGINVTPSVIQETYNITNGTYGQAPNNILAVAEFGGEFGQYYSPDDLQMFQSSYNLPIQPVAKVVGKNDGTQPTGEASLDIQYIMGVAPKVPAWFWSWFDTYIGWLEQVDNSTVVPYVFSVSYNFGDEYEQSESSRAAMDNQFQLLALRGVSMLFSSGDQGTGHTGTLVCGKFNPGYPAASPFVTSVGATYVESLGDPEIAAPFSGGGSSFAYARPSYQASVVSKYLNITHLPSQSYFNISGRFYPDLSALGTNFQIVVTGGVFPISGTSASAPVIAGLIALVNDELIQRGQPTLGFLNPLLYQLYEKHPDAFFDITQGENRSKPCPAGFLAAPGFDAVTGLGSINFPKFRDYILNDAYNELL